jgi:hypothetical protein
LENLLLRRSSTQGENREGVGMRRGGAVLAP